jgi:acetyl esterase/lipase
MSPRLLARAAVAVAAAGLAACPGGGAILELGAVSYDGRHATTVLDVYLPDDGATGRPAVLAIHGGAWKGGSRAHHADHARRLAASGYVAISIDYRLSGEAIFPAPVQDAWCALAFVRAQASAWGIDPARIAVTGYSAGGHLASLLGVGADVAELAPDCAAGPTGRPAAVISGAGPQDLRGAYGTAPAIVELLGGGEAEHPERFATASPITHAGADAAPFLFIHGSDDWFVPLAQSRAMRDALRGHGVDARLLELRGVGHLVGVGGDGGRQELGVLAVDEPEAWIATMAFLADTVGVP